jgi:hypothetical protein
MVVDGEANVRTCVTPLREGMRVETQIGAGTTGAGAAGAGTTGAGTTGAGAAAGVGAS